MVEQLGHFIGGKRLAGKSGRHGDVFNPAAGEITGQVAFADNNEIDEAVRVARAAFPAWAATPRHARAADRRPRRRRIHHADHAMIVSIGDKTNEASR
jgi:acyl-CoA reductase-like NAD-dependent aldehyde dehydrogenase